MSTQTGYYKVKPGVGIFWDPTQSKGFPDKLLPGQIAELENTFEVNRARTAGRLEMSSLTEYTTYKASIETEQSKSAAEKTGVAEAFKKELAEIGERAQKEAKTIVENAWSEAKIIIEDAETEAQQKAKVIIDQATKDAEKILEKANKAKNNGGIQQ